MCDIHRATLFIMLIVFSIPSWAQEIAPNADQEQAVRACVEQYVDAFNRGDAEAIAKLWSERGVWISPGGDRIAGREAIRAELESYFAVGQQQALTLSETNVRFLAPTVAVEEGTARVVRQGEAPEESTYIAIHVKQGDQWRLDSVRETAIPNASSNYEYLKSLEWMVGTWIDRDGDSELETTCEWTKNKNFMTRSFRVKTDEQTTMEGTQVIGYDAVKQQIRSWVFDTEGGIGEGSWQQDGESWIVKSSHHLATGQVGSSMNIITQVDGSSFLWQSTGRELDGEILPDIDPVTVVRK